ncbi:hypothetical protein [Bradyrhizobium sp. AZCC 1678]|uniref:hypothetical protein n=1 Tax=Bradyrhizobium sp. AZCC 1678 TaxID=3117030 RepID=UPI002FEF33DA
MILTMSRPFAIYIGLLGVATLVVIAWPPIALFGLFLGVVPGIFFWVAPSLFVYSLLWWSTRAAIQQTPIARRAQAGLLRFVVPAFSAAIIAVPAVLIPYLNNMRAEEVAQRLRDSDREPDEPIVLPETVALVMDGNYNWPKKKPFCETLCVRLLFNSSVARVIAVDPAYGSTAAFWIERREVCPDRPNLNFDVRWTTDFPLTRGDTPEDRVRARIAGGECLMEGDGHLEEATATISYRHVQKGTTIFQRPWSLQPGPPVVNRLEISNTSGATLYRRTEVILIDLTTPLQIATAAGLLTTVTYAGWARYNKTLGQIGPHGRDVLPYILRDAVKTPEKNPH